VPALGSVNVINVCAVAGDVCVTIALFASLAKF
jgi:hypothetical protein